MLRTHVLVIGGGPAGSMAARFLADSGIDTVLLERDMSYVKPCGGGIPSTALHEFSISEDVVKKKIKKIRIVSPKGEDVEVELKGGHLCITRRGEFDAKLREIAKNSGASVVEAEFIKFEETGKTIISTARKKSSNEEIKLQSDYVIASDGITFRAGSSIGHAKPDCLSTISAHITSDGFDACEFWFGSNHASRFYSWIFPSSGYSSIGTGSANPRELSHLLDTFIGRRFGMPLKNFTTENFSGQNFINKPRAFKIPEWNGTLFNINNILFAGDAAGAVMPITYEGIYYAMKSGEFAARAIAEGRPSVYKKLWSSRFRNRFLLMSKIRDYLFKSDENIEKFVALHKRPEVQEIAMRLWLKKETGSSALISYMKIFKHLLDV
jgi:geranylgeranyl reductase